MTYRTKIAFSIVTLAAGIVTMAAVLHWASERARYNLQRTHYAHEEYAGYLTLSAATFRYFKQVRRDLIEGDGRLRFDVEPARRDLLQALDQIEAKVEAENRIGLRPDEEDLETQRLARLTEQIEIALDEVAEAQRLLGIGEQERALLLLTTSLEDRIDRQVSAIIDAGLIDERREVEQAKAASDGLAAQLNWGALMALASAVSFAALSIGVLLVRLHRPLKALEEGTKRIAEGAFDHSIEIDGRDEFAALGRRFNAMAAQLGDQHRALDHAHRHLQDQVAAQTAKLRHVNEELRQRDEMRSRFFADISHEMRTPITVMRGLAEVAMRSKRDHEAAYRTALGRIVDVSGQLTRLVNDLFLIARSEFGALDLNRTSVDLETIIEAVRRDLQPLYVEAGARLQVEPARQPVMVFADKERLRQVITILIENALKHGPENVVTTVRLTAGESDGLIEVIDNGYGIKPEELGRVFDRFYHGNRSGGKLGSTGGLGLPIAKSLVEAHGGEIRVESECGSGTVFTVALPLSDGRPPSTSLPVGEGEFA